MSGLLQINNVTLSNITQIANVTNPAEFFINVNHFIFKDLLFFILICLLWGILFFASQERNPNFMANMLSAGAICSIISLLSRGFVAVVKGVQYALLTDWLMWIFPLITVILGLIAFINKDS